MSSPVRVILAGAAALVLLGATFLVVVRPAHQRMAVDRQAINQRRAQLEKLERVTRRIKDLQDEIRRLQDALAFFENRLPQEHEIDVILREVWVIAEAGSLAPLAIRTRPPVPMARCNAQPIALTLEGPFEGLYEFLLALERLPRITKVRDMQIQRSPLTEGSVRADLLVEIYFEK
jgi:Tfp pilus assembly protein PilO